MKKAIIVVVAAAAVIGLTACVNVDKGSDYEFTPATYTPPAVWVEAQSDPAN